jgi:lipoic acid synthetase
MVDRDDLPDQGASHIVSTVKELKSVHKELRVEALVGDFQGRLDLVEQVANSGMEVYAHNIETVERLQGTVRDRRAGYAQTLKVLEHARKSVPGIVTKTSLMLGLGEEDGEIRQALQDIRDAGVEIVTFGQYLQPTKRHMKVTKYVTPEEFQEWKRVANEMGMDCASGPMVRSSYKAGDFFKERLALRAAKATAKAEEAAASASQVKSGPRPVWPLKDSAAPLEH